jgi:serine/threonine protein kinase
VGLRSPSFVGAFKAGRAAFIRDARILARCDHASLLRVQRVWRAFGTVYCIMPYYPGQDLLAVRQGMSTAPNEPALCALLDALLGALEHLHNAGQVHGRVTPRNILLLPDDRPVLLGLGSAGRALRVDAAGQTPAEPAGPWSDLRALGAVAQFCITGQPAAEPAAAPGDAWLDLPERSHCGPALREAVDVLQAAGPGVVQQTLVRCRALLRDRPALAASQAEPTPDPVAPVPCAVLMQSCEPRVADAVFIAQVEQIVRLASRQARLTGSVGALREPRQSEPPPWLLPSTPNVPRIALWAGAAAVVLAVVGGAAVWQFNERAARDAPQRVAAAADALGAAPHAAPPHPAPPRDVEPAPARGARVFAFP